MNTDNGHGAGSSCLGFFTFKSRHMRTHLHCIHSLTIILCQIVIIVFVGIVGDPFVSRSCAGLGLFACCATTLSGLNSLVNAAYMAWCEHWITSLT